MRNHFWEERFVLFFRVLLVQNAVLLVTESNAAEAVLTCLAAIAVAHVIAKPHVPAERHIDRPAGDCTVPELLAALPAGAVAGVNVFGIVEGNRMRAVLASVAIEASETIPGVEEVIADDVLGIEIGIRAVQSRTAHCQKLFIAFLPR